MHSWLTFFQCASCGELIAQAKRECAWGIIYAIDNFGWAIEYILQSINDCQQEGNVDVLCAESIADIVFSGRVCKRTVVFQSTRNPKPHHLNPRSVNCPKSKAHMTASTGTGMMPAVAWAYRDCQKPFPIA